MNCNTLGILTSPPQMYHAFYPNAIKRQQQQSVNSGVNNSNANNTTSSSSRRQLVQIKVTGRAPVVPPHSKLTCRPCAKFLQGNCMEPNCQYNHLLFPRDFSKPNRIEMCKWVEDANHLEWAEGPKTA